jgi:hypothetical protein
VQGSVLYFDGATWVPLAPGAAGNVLTTQGAGANPIWNPPISIPGAVQGSILYLNGAGVWTHLPPGAAGDMLQTQGAGANPAWATLGAGPSAEEQVIFFPENPWEGGLQQTGQSVNFQGGSYFATRPCTFNRMALGESNVGDAGNAFTCAMYQASDGLVVDPWPRIATFNGTSTGNTVTQILTPNEGTISLAVGPFLLISAVDALSNVRLFKYDMAGNPRVLTTNPPAGQYPMNFGIGAVTPPAPATISFASMTGSNTTHRTLMARWYTV